MRKVDKLINIKKANILSEQRYLITKGLINENTDILDESDRMSMDEFLGTTTNNVDTLFKMFSKYTPNDSWLMSIGYVNNVDVPVKIKNEDFERIEAIVKKLNNPAFNAMINSDEWNLAKTSSGIYSNPFAPRKINKESIPSKIYTTKSFMIQWGNMKNKQFKDSEIKTIYDKYGLSWAEHGGIDPDDKRGLGWEPIIGTPFDQHTNTKTNRLAFWSKKEGVKNGKTKYFLNFDDTISELNKDEIDFIFSLSPKKDKMMPKRLLDMENQEAAKEIFDLENAYEYKSLNLDKITYINCSMVINGENKKFSYINRNAIPDGLKPGDFKDFINPV